MIENNKKKYAKLRSQYTEVENNVYELLEEIVANSKNKSKSFNVPSIVIDNENFYEIIYLDEMMQLVDENNNLSGMIMLELNEMLEVIWQNV